MRLDINSLRAIAVIFVIGNHANLTFFSGGFVGVDIFFVVSGYLITRMMSLQIQEGRFSFSTFYVNRIKRILPAFYFVCLTCILIAYLFTITKDFNHTINSVFAPILFVKNFALIFDGGSYFNTYVSPEFFTHMWSLSVEEQFYILWPALLYLAFKLRFNLIVFTVALSLCSVYLSEVLLKVDTNAAYYLVFTRFYEFGVGALTSFISIRLSNRSNNILATIGYCGLLLSLFFIDKNSNIPGVIALIPTLSTAMIIYAGSDNQPSFFSSFTNNKLITQTGVISYSLYLWHWPIFVLLTYYHYELTGVTLVVSLVFMYLISMLTHKFIEQPYRVINTTNNKVVLYYLLIPFTLFFSLLFVEDKQSFSQDIDYKHYQILSPKYEKCLSGAGKSELTPCIGNEEQNTNILVWGDSHASMFINTLEVLNKDNFQVYTKSACAPVLDLYLFEKHSVEKPVNLSCIKRNELVMEYIQNNNIDTVYLAARWPLYVNGEVLENGLPLVRLLSSSEEAPPQSSKENSLHFGKGLNKTLEKLEKLDVKVIIVQSFPSFINDPSRCNQINDLPLSRFKNCRQDINYFITENIKVDKLFNELATKYENIWFIPTWPYLCSDNKCNSKVKGTVMYFDDDHLNSIGGKRLGELMKSSGQYMFKTPLTVTNERQVKLTTTMSDNGNKLEKKWN